MPIRTLADEGGPNLPMDQVRAYAAQFTITDAETGEDRAGLPTDFFPANTAAGAPDLSLMAKARKGFSGPNGLGINQILFCIGGPEYIASVLTGYNGEEVEEFGSVFYENHTFPGGRIKMPPPLSDGQVEFADGAPNDVTHMSEDVAAFLMWAAEPHMMARKQAGFIAVLFLAFLSTMLYLTNKRLWSVSYTHLDVYKRQRQSCSRIRPPPCKPIWADDRAKKNPARGGVFQAFLQVLSAASCP